jgi:cytochrome c oxidase subunit IV
MRKQWEVCAALIAVALFAIAVLGPVLWDLDLEYAIVFAILWLGHMLTVTMVLMVEELRKTLGDIVSAVDEGNGL